MDVNEWVKKATVYFSGAMEHESMQLFEKETAADNELNELMQLWLQTNAEGKLYEQNEKGATDFINTHKKLKDYFIDEESSTTQVFKQFLNDKEDISSKRNNLHYLLRWFAAAAIIAGIIFFSKLLFFPESPSQSTISSIQKNEPLEITKDSLPLNDDTEHSTKKDTVANISPQKLFADLFVPDAPPEDQRGVMDDAFFYYEMKQYKKAIAAIDDIPNKPLTRSKNHIGTTDSFYIPYYKALSYMSLGNTKAALPLLQQCIQQKPSDENLIKAQWYLVLAYLKENKTGETQNTLKAVLQNNTGSIYKTKAAALYKKLNG